MTKKKIAEQIINAFGAQDMITYFMDKVSCMLSPEQKEKFDAYNKQIAEATIDIQSDVYSEMFTEEELIELLNIYRNPTFNKMMSNNVIIATETNKRIKPRVKEIREKIFGHLEPIKNTLNHSISKKLN